jgi:hypothetical protein
MKRAPKFVHGFIDRHGKARFYFRRPGFKFNTTADGTATAVDVQA